MYLQIRYSVLSDTRQNSCLRYAISLPILIKNSRTCTKPTKANFLPFVKENHNEMKIVSFVNLHVSIPLLRAVFK